MASTRKFGPFTILGKGSDTGGDEYLVIVVPDGVLLAETWGFDYGSGYNNLYFLSNEEYENAKKVKDGYELEEYIHEVGIKATEATCMNCFCPSKGVSIGCKVCQP